MMRIETYSRLPNLIFMRKLFALAIVLSLAWTAGAPAQEKLNHLSGERSPYLKRAIAQPVDWYPWGEAAFGRAKELDRPILLDVGAVWCPWCNLMDRDTYTNAATADYINQHFVAVKVDFDASPKLVAQLQRAQAILNLPAGLPLTSFITPDGKLYFGAGYLPSKHKGDRQSFQEAADEALARYVQKSKIDEESFQLEVEK
jgi:uncharacterized protein YyaL (SSP411 family)